jgi:hypothetical protein
MGTSAVFALALIGYSSLSHTVTDHPIKSFHISQSDCIQEKTYQNQRGHAESYNRSYVCLRVADPEIRSQLRSRHSDRSYSPRRSNGRIVIELFN